MFRYSLPVCLIVSALVLLYVEAALKTQSDRSDAPLGSIRSFPRLHPHQAESKLLPR